MSIRDYYIIIDTADQGAEIAQFLTNNGEQVFNFDVATKRPNSNNEWDGWVFSDNMWTRTNKEYHDKRIYITDFVKFKRKIKLGKLNEQI